MIVSAGPGYGAMRTTGKHPRVQRVLVRGRQELRVGQRDIFRKSGQLSSSKDLPMETERGQERDSAVHAITGT